MRIVRPSFKKKKKAKFSKCSSLLILILVSSSFSSQLPPPFSYLKNFFPSIFFLEFISHKVNNHRPVYLFIYLS